MKSISWFGISKLISLFLSAATYATGNTRCPAASPNLARTVLVNNQLSNGEPHYSQFTLAGSLWDITYFPSGTTRWGIVSEQNQLPLREIPDPELPSVDLYSESPVSSFPGVYGRYIECYYMAEPGPLSLLSGSQISWGFILSRYEPPFRNKKRKAKSIIDRSSNSPRQPPLFVASPAA